MANSMAKVGNYIDMDIVAALVLVEIESLLWWSNLSPLGTSRLSRRQLLSALISDVGLALALKFAIMNFWPVKSWADAFQLTGWVTAVYASLEAPHRIKGSNPLTKFVINVLHRASVILITVLTLFFFHKKRMEKLRVNDQ